MAVGRARGRGGIKYKSTDIVYLDGENKRPSGRKRAVRSFHGSDGRTYYGKGAKARVKLENKQIVERDYLKGASTMEARSRTMPGSMQIKG